MNLDAGSGVGTRVRRVGKATREPPEQEKQEQNSRQDQKNNLDRPT